MKTIFFLLFLFTAFTSAQPVLAKAELSADHHYFGNVKPGEKLKYELFVKNIGEVAFYIKDISIHKTFISAEWSKVPIRPGKERRITLTLSVPADIRGFNRVTIKVFYNDDYSDPLKFTLEFRVSE